MAARKEFEVAWKEAGKIYATLQDTRISTFNLNMKSKSDFPLDHEIVRDDDSMQDDDDGYVCTFDDSDDSDNSSAGGIKDKGIKFPFVMPVLKLGPMLLSKDETKDKDFLASVGMETTLEFVDYRFEDRGNIKAGQQSPCDIHFLRSIKFNLLYLALQYILVGKHSYGKIDFAKFFASVSGCLRETTLEIERLHEYPSLFPSRDVENAFDHDMGILFSDVFKYNGPEGENIREKEKKQLLQAVLQESGPAFAEQDPHRKPWQQYMHDRAPGAGLDQSKMLDLHSNQVIPHSALRILECWTIRYHLAFRGMKEGCRKRGIVFTIPPLELGIKPCNTKEGNFRTFIPSTNYIPPVQAASNHRPRATGVSRLEDLNEDANFLTRPNANLDVTNPNFRSLIVADYPMGRNSKYPQGN